MKFEVESAANFLSNLLKLHSNVLSQDQLERFREAIESHLMDHYNNHWFPETPTKGSGYRCIRINHKMDPILSRAGKTCGLDNSKLQTIFPNELTLWIDPMEVSYRIGENGSICVLFDGSSSKNQSGSSDSATDNNSNGRRANGTSHNGMNGDHQGKHHPPVGHTLSHGNQSMMNGGGHHQGSSGSHHHKPHTGMGQHQMHIGSNGHQQHNGHHHQQQHSVNGHNNHHNHHTSRSGNRSPTDSTLSSSTSTMSSPSPSSSPDWCKSQYERRSSPDQWIPHHQQQHLQQPRMAQGVMGGDRHSSPVSVMNGVGMHHQQSAASSFGMDMSLFGYHAQNGGYAFNHGVMNSHQNQRHTPQRPPPQFAGYSNGWNAGSPY